MPSPGFILALLLTVCFTLSTWLQPHAINWNKNRAQNDDLLAITLGDARRLFANHFFVKADVYFHSGYYPSIFDQAANHEVHIAEEAGSDTRDHSETEHEEEHGFLGPPRDWIERFGRNFFNIEHTHLAATNADEMLPWMRIAAELDPQQVETFTVGAFWLRSELKKPREAEQFLREGLRANPNSYEILFELGRLYDEDYKDPDRARNIWQLAERKLETYEAASDKSDLFMKRRILDYLARLAEKRGNFSEAIGYLQKLYDAWPPEEDAVRAIFKKQITELRQKLAK